MRKKRDLLWAMSPMLTINTISGIQPFSLEKGSSQRRVFFVLNCTTFAVLFCFTSYLTVNMPLHVLFFSPTLDVSAIVKMTWAVFILSSAALSGCMHLLRKEQIISIFNGLAELVKELWTNGMMRYRKFILLQVFPFFINIANFVVLIWKSIKIVGDISTHLCNVPMMMFWTSIHLEQEMQFYNHLYLLSRCTRSINTKLATLNLFVTSDSRSQRGGETCVLRQLSRLKIFQNELYKIYRSTKNVYRLPNLLLVLNNLLNLSFVLYSIFDYEVFILKGQPDSTILFASLLWTFSDFFIMLSIIF
ncbi:Gustatory receptor 8, partial [Ladona fulva]